MGLSSRRKGLSGEREVARLFEAAGFDVRGLEASGDHLVIGPGFTLHSETKRAERLKIPEWVRQTEDEAPAGTVPVLSFRQSGNPFAATPPWRSVLQTADLIRLLTR